MTRTSALVAAAIGAFFTVAPAHAWETESQAAQQVRHLLASPEEHFGSGVLSTTYPAPASDSPSTGPGTGTGKGPLPHAPLSGPEYFAPCYPNGDLAFLALPVSQNWRNALSTAANVTFSVGSNPDPRVPDWRHLADAPAKEWDPARPSWRRGMPSKLRATLFGRVSEVTSQRELEAVRDCFVGLHPDAKYWMPGSRQSPHAAKWVRFEVESVYAVGGFGDEHRIGWIDRTVYAQAQAQAQAQAEAGGHTATLGGGQAEEQPGHDAALLHDVEVNALFGENDEGTEGVARTSSTHKPEQMVFSP